MSKFTNRHHELAYIIADFLSSWLEDDTELNFANQVYWMLRFCKAECREYYPFSIKIAIDID